MAMAGTYSVKAMKSGGLAIIAIGVLIAGRVYGSPIFIPLAFASFL
jgi:hypothetical protein